jgi:hypothetical protein
MRPAGPSFPPSQPDDDSYENKHHHHRTHKKTLHHCQPHEIPHLCVALVMIILVILVFEGIFYNLWMPLERVTAWDKGVCKLRSTSEKVSVSIQEKNGKFRAFVPVMYRGTKLMAFDTVLGHYKAKSKNDDSIKRLEALQGSGNASR